MAKNESKDNLLYNIEKFHADNLYLPTRTVYFGKIANEIEDYDVVNCVTASQLIKNLHILDTISCAPINLLLNTPGGSWDDGMAIYDVIRFINSPVYIIGMGKIYSMGSIIIQAGDKRLLMPNTLFMIHDGHDGYVGDAKSYEAWAEISKDIRMKMYEIYHQHMVKKDKRITIKHIEDMCSHDKILNAEQTVEIGLADEIMKIKPKKIYKERRKRKNGKR